MIVFGDKKRHEIDTNISNWDTIEVPCGQCIECRLKKRKDWAQRIMFELPKHNYSYFITLTYDEEHIPRSIINPVLTSLRTKDMQLFLKRWRGSKTSQYRRENLKYFYCGEYGETTARAHYHIIAFCDNPIPDMKFWSSNGGNPVYRSETLERIWGQGNILIGTVTLQSAEYVRGYITKKQLGKRAEIYKKAGIKEPYVQMSNGIGKLTPEQLYNIYNHDSVTICRPTGKLTVRKPAKTYDEALRDIMPEWYELIKEQRKDRRIRSRISQETQTTLTQSELRENKRRSNDKKYALMERSDI